ncbi:hypothetical protein N8351_00310 [Flavobacteriaceae bacterium]|nr:hypothetical protein [Flavobacteriaceae bacterium]
MEIVIHRINKIQELKNIPLNYGCEIDIRANGSKLVLNHEPLIGGDSFIDYLDEYRHGLLVLNIKEAGIEEMVLKEVRKRNISNFFLLDVEFPYLYRASRDGERSIAIRYSEDEPIESVNKYKNKVDWVWIDTNTKLPLDTQTIVQLKGFKTCLVCPERWGRPNDIILYRKQMQLYNFELNAVMTSLNCVKYWELSKF